MATYNVMGAILEDVREQIVNGGHCLAFHSYDHKVRHRPQNAIEKIWELMYSR